MQTLNEDVNGEINYLIGNDVEELEASIKDVYKQLEELKEKRKETVSRKIAEKKGLDLKTMLSKEELEKIKKNSDEIEQYLYAFSYKMKYYTEYLEGNFD